jgi:sugar transferase (PEP-CTERM system associated)
VIELFGLHVDRRLFALWVTDTLVLVASFYLGYIARYAAGEPLAETVATYASHALVFAAVAQLAFAAVGLYDRDSFVRIATLAVRLTTAFALIFALVAIFGYAFRDIMIWRSGLLIGCAVAWPALFAIHLAYGWLGRRSSLVRRVFIVGEPDLHQRLQQVEAESHAPGFRICGFLDIAAACDGRVPLETFLDELRRTRAEEVVYAVRDRRGRLPYRHLLGCRNLGVRVLDYSAFYERETGRVDLDLLRPAELVFGEGFEGSRLETMAKRLFDLAAAIACLVLTLPVLVLAALAIRLEDGGPVLYRQWRVGAGGRPFQLYKFRSMRVDAERDTPRFAEERDPRCTRVGRFLRRTRIDELPQLFNILRGDMSFVGPRPERPVFVRSLVERIPYFEARNRVKPGLTGWAQLNHSYAADEAAHRLKLAYDLYYLKHWNLMFDFAILLRTLRVVLWPAGVR